MACLYITGAVLCGGKCDDRTNLNADCVLSSLLRKAVSSDRLELPILGMCTSILCVYNNIFLWLGICECAGVLSRDIGYDYG